MKGDWKKCSVAGENAGAEITAMLTEKIKQTGLRTYLLAFSS